MAISILATKLLWGRSGNRCAICRLELSMEGQQGSALPLGEQAHIVAREPEGPRGASNLDSAARDAYSNLILLCPTDHTRVDKLPKDFPVDALLRIKTEHETWVRSRLEPTDRAELAADELYASIAAQFVELCNVHGWGAWISGLTHLEPRWRASELDAATGFQLLVERAAMPGSRTSLERALRTLGKLIALTRQAFEARAERRGDDFVVPKFYKISEWNEERYRTLGTEWDELRDRLKTLVFELTRAANWVGDEVRASLDPSFLLLEGRLAVVASIHSDIPGEQWVPEYLAEERAALPEHLAARLERGAALLPF